MMGLHVHFNIHAMLPTTSEVSGPRENFLPSAVREVPPLV